MVQLFKRLGIMPNTIKLKNKCLNGHNDYRQFFFIPQNWRTHMTAGQLSDATNMELNYV